MEKQVIPIDPDGRYLVLLKYIDGQIILREQLEDLSKAMEAWWNSGEKFFPLTVGDGVEVTLERLEDV